MVFSSLTFLFYFLPITLGLYYLTPKRYRNIVLLIASLFFYAWGEPVYIGLMIFSSVVDYMHGLLIDKYRENKYKAKLLVISSILINLGLLAFFKYGDFIITNVNMLFNTSFKLLNLPLPIGISFYTFQTMSYTIDVYRNKVPAQKSPIALATYVTLFPQLIAGPIVRYKTVAKQLTNRTENYHKIAYGIKRFIIGLAKKVLLANNIGLLFAEVQASSIANLSVATAWLGLIAFGFQIYFDFSGYSDMAIGLGHMFGFSFLENFNYPYISQSITEFWRRWHISLGTWFKDYVYIPLGGNRKGKIRTYFNLLVVWLLTGFWHGANYNFMLWGLYFAVIIALEKLFLLSLLNKLPTLLKRLYTLMLILISWVLFNYEGLNDIYCYINKMFAFTGKLIDNSFLYLVSNYAVLLVLLTIFSTPIIKNFVRKVTCNYKKYSILQLICFVTLFIISIAYLVDASYNPFLYFRF